MTRHLRAVADQPTAGGMPEHLRPIGEPPAAGPVGPLTRARLRRLITGTWGEFPTLDAHLDLLDARGAWYAERALGAWDAGQPDSFFGLVRHVVRTQMTGPAPSPDIEAWLAAGRPADTGLAARWDLINGHRYGPTRSAPATSRPGDTGDDIADLDRVIADWPEALFDRFVRAYASLEHVLERREIVLPSYDS